MQLNATVIDSSIYHDIFSTTAVRAVWSDQARVQRYLDVEKALSLVEGRLGVIPSEAAEEIGRHCNVSETDFERMTSAMEHIGYETACVGSCTSSVGINPPPKLHGVFVARSIAIK